MLTMATTGATAAAARAATTFGTFSHKNDDKSDNHNKNSTNDKSCHIENPFYQVTDDGKRINLWICLHLTHCFRAANLNGFFALISFADE